ncbi:MAG: hypothetical protein NW226_23620 [Microscillaceae bacterium]|nr:hypothetical protein [Microscillaceae bacterium]
MINKIYTLIKLLMISAFIFSCGGSDAQKEKIYTASSPDAKLRVEF